MTDRMVSVNEADVREAVNNPVTACSSCGWPWPLAGPPPDGAECDNCGDDEWEENP